MVDPGSSVRPAVDAAVSCLASPVAGSPSDATGCAVCRGGRGGIVDAVQPERAVDLRAAHLASAGDQTMFEALIDLVRGPFPSEQVMAEAGHAAYALWAGATTGDERIAGGLLRELAEGGLSVLFWLHIGVDGIEIYQAEHRRTGLPRSHGPVASWTWSALAPGLSTDSTRLRFHLAGGVGTDLHPSPAASVGTVLANLPPIGVPADGALIIVNGSWRWPLLDRIAHDLGRSRGALALLQCPNDDPAGLIRDLVRQAPLTHTYELVQLQPDEVGNNRLVLQEVFGGATAGSREAQVAVYAPVGIEGPVTLPIVVRHNGAPPADWLPVRLARVALARGRRQQVTVVLDDDAGIDFPELADAGDDRRPWPELLAAQPAAVTPQLLDIAFLVELVDGNDADPRLAFFHHAVNAILAEAGNSSAVRVGLIGYRQHRDADDDPLVVVDLGPSDVAAKVSVRWRLDGNRNDLAAALEDGLDAVSRLSWNRPGARRVLISIGSRAPYPHEMRDHAGICRRGLRFAEGLKSLHGLGLVRVAGWSEPGWDELLRTDAEVAARGEQTWKALSANGITDPTGADVNGLLVAAGITFASRSTSLTYQPRRSA
jgi:hypothetical protein